MTGKEALKELRQEYFLENGKPIITFDGDDERLNIIEKDLDMLEELKYPHDEYETEDYLCTREAYYNENLGELCFAYTIYKWDGTYREHKILKKPLKMKNWVEVFHAGCGTGKKELNDEYIQDYLKIKEIMKKEVVKNDK